MYQDSPPSSCLRSSTQKLSLKLAFLLHSFSSSSGSFEPGMSSSESGISSEKYSFFSHRKLMNYIESSRNSHFAIIFFKKLLMSSYSRDQRTHHAQQFIPNPLTFLQLAHGLLTFASKQKLDQVIFHSQLTILYFFLLFLPVTLAFLPFVLLVELS